MTEPLVVAGTVAFVAAVAGAVVGCVLLLIEALWKRRDRPAAEPVEPAKRPPLRDYRGARATVTIHDEAEGL